MRQLTVWREPDEIMDSEYGRITYGRITYGSWCDLECNRMQTDKSKKCVIKPKKDGTIAIFR